MIKNQHFRNWYYRYYPKEYGIKISKEIEHDFRVILKSNPTTSERQKAENERNFNMIMVTEELELYLSKKIINKALKYDIHLSSPQPSTGTSGLTGQEWYSSTYFGYYLSDKGRYDLKMKIREEQKWKKENIAYYSSIVFGFLGLLVGLLSLIKL